MKDNISVLAAYGAVFEPRVEHESQMYVFHTLLKIYIYKIHLFYLHRM